MIISIIIIMIRCFQYCPRISRCPFMSAHYFSGFGRLYVCILAMLLLFFALLLQYQNSFLPYEKKIVSFVMEIFILVFRWCSHTIFLFSFLFPHFFSMYEYVCVVCWISFTSSCLLIHTYMVIMILYDISWGFMTTAINALKQREPKKKKKIRIREKNI